MARSICFSQSSQVYLEIMYAEFLVDVNIIIVQEARPARLQGKYGNSE